MCQPKRRGLLPQRHRPQRRRRWTNNPVCTWRSERHRCSKHVCNSRAKRVGTVNQKSECGVPENAFCMLCCLLRARQHGSSAGEWSFCVLCCCGWMAALYLRGGKICSFTGCLTQRDCHVACLTETTCSARHESVGVSGKRLLRVCFGRAETR